MKKSRAEIYVEQRLSQWAGWYLAIFDRIGYYPDRTTEFRLMEGGGIVSFSTAPKAIPDHALAEEIHSMVNIMARSHPQQADVLKQQYLTQASQTEKAAALNMGSTRFRALLQMAKQWLAGRLSYEYDTDTPRAGG